MALRFSALGDVLHAVPAVRALRAAFPRARIGWAVEDRCAEVLRWVEAVDEVVVFERRSRGAWGAAGALRAAWDLARGGWDVAIDFHGNLKSGVAARASRARLRIGFPPHRGAREGNPGFSNCRPLVAPWCRHKVERNLALLAPLGISASQVDPRPSLPRPAGAAAGRAAAALAGRRRPLVAVHPAVSRFGAIKRWPPERFGEVLRILGCEAVVTHGPGERPVAEAVAAASGGLARPAPDPVGLADLAALLAASDLVLGCDTGPLHLGAALGVPTVTVFGPKDPAVYAPRGPGVHRVVHAEVPCRPCVHRRCHRRLCTEMVFPEAVAQACRALLD